MSWYKKSMATVWGKMASGIMFRCNGHILLQARSSDVEDAGVWGVPGGALKGTEGFYESTELPEPTIDRAQLNKLFESALMEVQEELGSVPDLTPQQVDKAIQSHVMYRKDNFVYVTFVVDLTEEQASEIDLEGRNWESEGHEWMEQENPPSNTHPGVSYVLDRLRQQVDVTRASFHSSVKTADSQWTQGQVFIEEDMQYDVEKLKKIVKDNKVVDLKVEKLIKQLYDTSVWGYGNRCLSPMMVLNDPTYDHMTIKHMSQIRTCNLDHPILVRVRDHKVIDGYHRLTKAVLLGREKIKAVMIQEEQMDAAAIDLTSGEEYVRPHDVDSLRKNSPDLLKCPIHIWRANTGIELIHKEPDLKEFMRTLKNWEKMTDEMKKKSDEESCRLFGKDNLSRVSDILQEYERG